MYDINQAQHPIDDAAIPCLHFFWNDLFLDIRHVTSSYKSYVIIVIYVILQVQYGPDCLESTIVHSVV